MKYFSFADQFGLTPDELLELSSYKLSVILKSFNSTENRHFSIKDIENVELRKLHYLIEKHLWLKQLLLKKFNNIKNEDIIINDERIEDNEFKQFLENYLKPLMSESVNNFIEHEKYSELYKILSLNIFTESTRKHIISILNRKISYATDYLEDKLLGKTESNINYVKSYRFINTLNIFPKAFEKELTQLYNTLLEIHDSHEINSNSSEFKFSSQALVAFGKSNIDDVALKLFIDSNAENATKYAYRNNLRTVEETNKKLYLFLGIVSLLLIFVSTVAISKHLTSSSKSKNSNKKETPISKKVKRNNYDNRIRFHYTLKHKTLKKKSDSIPSFTIVDPYTNPYPKTFKRLPNNKTRYNTKQTLINNKTNNNLIIFRMVKGVDQAIYIPKDKSRFIALKISDSLLFYSGKNFVTSSFSHFKQNAAISEIYTIKNISDSLAEVSVTAAETNKI